MAGVGTAIFERPRPLSRHRRADPGRVVRYTLNCEEPVNLTPPATDVVAYLGAPTGDDVRPVGDGGLAVTRFRAVRPTVVFAQAALTDLSPAAVQSLAAHDLLTAPTGVS